MRTTLENLIQPRGHALAARPSTFDIPILLRTGNVPGSGMRVQYAMQRDRAGTFAEEEEENAAADLATTKWVAELLHAHYRGHFFAVATDSHQGVCWITIPILLGNWKFMLRLKDLNPAKVIKAGGELLERFNIPRSNIDVGLAAFVDARKRSVSGIRQKPPGGL